MKREKNNSKKAEAGRKGGSVTSKKKAKSSRLNGKLGGRPKGVKNKTK